MQVGTAPSTHSPKCQSHLQKNALSICNVFSRQLCCMKVQASSTIPSPGPDLLPKQKFACCDCRGDQHSPSKRHLLQLGNKFLLSPSIDQYGETHIQSAHETPCQWSITAVRGSSITRMHKAALHRCKAQQPAARALLVLQAPNYAKQSSHDTTRTSPNRHLITGEKPACLMSAWQLWCSHLQSARHIQATSTITCCIPEQRCDRSIGRSRGYRLPLKGWGPLKESQGSDTGIWESSIGCQVRSSQP